MAKRTRAEVVRAICGSPAPPPAKPAELVPMVREEMGDTHQLELAEPLTRTTPWILSVRPL